MKYSKILEEKITIRDTVSIKLKDKLKTLLIKLVKGFRSSKDKIKFPQGVDINMRINKQNDLYDQVVVNNKTGQVVHEEHEKLSEHNLKKQKQI